MDILLTSKLNPEVLNLLQHIERFQENWNFQAHLSPDFYADLKKTSIITSAGASTRIEGSTLTDDEIKERLNGLKIQKITSRDEAEVAGYIDCKEYILEHYEELEISEHTIRSLHQMMMQYLSEDLFPRNQKGAYKNITNSVVKIDHSTGTQEIVFETTPPGPQTEVAMLNLVQNFKNFNSDKQYSALEIIAAFIVQFLAIHPFRDGNGRISRLLTDLCLLKHGYTFCMYSSHEKVIEDTKTQYYVALRQTQESFTKNVDINPWFFYFLKTLKKQTEYLQNKATPISAGTLTKKENIVLELIQKHQPVSIGFLERQSKINRATLKAILTRLKQSNTIKMEGERKGSRYWIHEP